MIDPRFTSLELVRYSKDGAISSIEPSFTIPGHQGPETFLIALREPISLFKTTSEELCLDTFKSIRYLRGSIYIKLGDRLNWPTDYQDSYEIEYVLDYPHLLKTFPIDLTGLLK